MNNNGWSIVKTKKRKIIRHGIFPLSGYASSDLDCLLPHLSWQRELVLAELSLNLAWNPAGGWRSVCWCCLKFVCRRWMLWFTFLRSLLSLRNGIRPAASNRTKNGLVVALLPCAVGISCWSGTPGDPKGATPGCWKISPWRPTSIRDLLAWSGI